MKKLFAVFCLMSISLIALAEGQPSIDLVLNSKLDLSDSYYVAGGNLMRFGEVPTQVTFHGNVCNIYQPLPSSPNSVSAGTHLTTKFQKDYSLTVQISDQEQSRQRFQLFASMVDSAGVLRLGLTCQSNRPFSNQVFTEIFGVVGNVKFE